MADGSTKTPEQAHAPAMADGAKCRECPMWGRELGPVPSEIRKNRKLFVLGEGPGPKEVLAERVFVAWSGQKLEEALEEGGWSRDGISIANTMRCAPPSDWSLEDLLSDISRKNSLATEKWERECEQIMANVPAGTSLESIAELLPRAPKLINNPIDCCAPALEKDLAEADPKVILALGNKALQAIAKRYGIPFNASPDANGRFICNISEQAGSPVELPDGKILCASYHPAFAAREKFYLDFVKDCIVRATLIADRGLIRPNYTGIDTPSLEQIVFFLRAARENQLELTVDIETDGIAHNANIRCIGVGISVPNGPEVAPTRLVLVVPLRDRDGKPYWDWDSEQLVREEVRLAFAELPCVFHNGLFDTAVLMSVGLWPKDKLWADTLIMARNTRYGDLPKNLGFLARRFTELRLWKKDIDGKFQDIKVTDQVLRAYNVIDVVATQIAKDRLSRDMIRDGMVESYAHDTRLAPIARDMGVRGIWIDEVERADLCVYLNNLTHEFRAKFHEKSGTKVNPRSGPQVAEWLYGDLGLAPPLNTEGYDFEEGDDPATSTPALLRILDLGLSRQAEEAVEFLLDYRACEGQRRVVDGLDSVQDEDTAWAHKAAGHTSLLPPVVVDDIEYKKHVAKPYRRDVLPARQAFSKLHASWNITATPTGRAGSNPNCFDRETELLTPEGWRSIGECRDEVVAQYSLDGSIEFVQSSSFLEKEVDEELIRIRSESVDLLVTEDHRLLLWERKRRVFKESLAGSALPSTCEIINAGCYAGGELELPKWKLILLSALQADGSWISRSDKAVVFRFDKDRKSARLRQALLDGGIDFSEKREAPSGRVRTRFYIPDLSWAEAYVSRPQKHFGSWILKLSRENLEFFARESMYWDGCFTRRSHYSSNEKINADWIQTAFVLSGTRANVRAYQATKSINWQVDVTKRDRSWLDEKRHRSKERYVGKVYCVSVPSSWLLVRRRGRVAVAGNCQNWSASLWTRAGDKKSRSTRRMMVAPPGHVIVGGDYEQVEARIGAVVMGDKLALKCLAEGKDLHLMAAAVISAADGEDIEDRYAVLAEWHGLKEKIKAGLASDHEKALFKEADFVRQAGKTTRFLMNYGGEDEKFVSSVLSMRNKLTNRRLFKGPDGGPISEKLPLEWARRWRERQPETKVWHRNVAKKLRLQGYTCNPWGVRRRRWFPGGPTKKNAPPNQEIQAQAGFFMNELILRMCEIIEPGSWSKWTGPFLNVHDDLKWIVPEDKAKYTARVLEECAYFEVEFEGGVMPFPMTAVISQNVADNK